MLHSNASDIFKMPNADVSLNQTRFYILLQGLWERTTEAATMYRRPIIGWKGVAEIKGSGSSDTCIAKL